MAISPADMQLFAIVVREGSFTRAARLLGVTKQTASERIGKLEGQLGVRLLERTTRRLRVTEAGATYAERCTAIAAQVEDANLEVQRKQSEPVGVLKVSAPVLYGRRYLAPVVASYLRRYPKMKVELSLSDRRVNFVEESVDVAIRVGPLDDSTLTARRLGDTRVYYVASPKYLAAHGAPTARTLKQARTVGVRAHETWEVGGVAVRVEPQLVVNDLEVACEAVKAGIGVGRLPVIVCREAVVAGKLKVLFRGVAALERAVFAVYPSRQYLPAKVRHFVDALAAEVEPMLPL